MQQYNAKSDVLTQPGSPIEREKRGSAKTPHTCTLRDVKLNCRPSDIRITSTDETYGVHCPIAHVLENRFPRAKQDAQLSQRDSTAGCVIVFAKSRTLELGDSDLRTLQVYVQPLSYNLPENLSNSVKKMQNKGYYSVQGHSRSSRSVPIESPYAISYQ